MNRKGSVTVIIVLIILVLVIVGVGAWIYSSHSAAGAPPKNPLYTPNQGTLTVEGDGTAYIEGDVIGQTDPCTAGGPCSLFVHTQNQNIELDYVSGDASGTCQYQQPASWVGASGTSNGAVGTIVQAHGAVTKIPQPGGEYFQIYTMDFCGSPRYFILGGSDPIPAGMGPATGTDASTTP